MGQNVRESSSALKPGINLDIVMWWNGISSSCMWKLVKEKRKGQTQEGKENSHIQGEQYLSA